MGYQVDWLVERRVMVYRFEGKLTLDDYFATLKAADVLVQDGDAPVHAISDSTDLLEMPKAPQDIVKMMTGTPDPDPRAGWVVQVTPNKAQKFMATLFSKMFIKKGNFHTVSTFREALEFIKARDQRLASLDLNQVERDYAAWKRDVVIEGQL